MTVTTLAGNSLTVLGVLGAETEQGARAVVPFNADFTGANNQTIIDLTYQFAGQTFTNPRTLFFDNSNNPNPVEVMIGQTQASFPIPPNSAGYFPLASQPNSRITLSSVGGASAIGVGILFNYDIPAVVWGGTGQPVIISGTAAVSAALNAFIDGSIVTIGKEADAAIVNPASSGTLMAFTKGLLTELVSLVNGLRTSADLPAGGTTVVNTSGNVANAAATTSLPAVAAKTNYVTGFEITGLGATAALTVVVTLGSLIGAKNFTYIIEVPAGVTTPITPLVVQFEKPIPANAVNSAITLTVGAFGAGNTNAAANIEGYVL